jgi:hypothetical protein
VFGDRFGGYSSGATWEDARLGLGNVRSWERTAIVSDLEWTEHLATAFGWLMPGKVRHFECGALPEASPGWAKTRPLDGRVETGDLPTADELSVPDQVDGACDSLGQH